MSAGGALRPHVILTAGDPRGIGPEVAHRAAGLLSAEEPDVCVSIAEGADVRPFPGSELASARPRPELSDADAGRRSAEAIETAARHALEGSAHALVTGPVHKPSLHAAGRHVPGVTELLQQAAAVEDVGMLMAAERTPFGRPLRVLLATTHHPLRAVPDLLTEDRIVAQTRLLDDALRRGWRIARPRVAVCGLNPHASDGGLFGDEEARVFAPALARLASDGFDVTGPLPADTVFQRALSGAFDAVVAPYHDVGMAAFKTVSFGAGVNVTLGLPFVRTSPDHGTAFDIAGTGKADASSMLEALRLAVRLVRGRFDTDSGGV